MLARTVRCLALLLVLVFVVADCAAAEVPAGLTLSPARVVLSSPEFRATVSLRNDGDRPLTLKVTVEAWAQNEEGKSVLSPSDDLLVEPASVSVPAHASAPVVVTVKVRPRGVEAAYRLFVDDGAAPATASGERISAKVFVHYGYPIAVPYLESVTPTGTDISIVLRNVGGAHMTVQSVRVRGVAATGRDVFEKTAEAGDLLAQRRLIFHIPIDGDQCAQTRQLIVSIITNQGTPISIVNLQPTSCPAKATSSGK